MNTKVKPNVSARLRFIAFMAIIVFSMAACDIGSLPNMSNPSSPSPSLPPDEIRLNSSDLTLIVGGKETLNVTVLPDNVANKAVNWTSGKPQVATVSSNGEINGVSPGSAIITATTVNGGKTATCTVSVIEAPPDTMPVPTSVNIFPPSLTLDIGDTDTLIVTVEPGNADKTVNWKSSNPAVAVVDTNGKITAKGAGIASIYVLTVVGGKQASSEVTVNKFIPDTVAAIMGHGYNITGRYAHSGDIKSPVLDLDKLLAAQKVKKDPNMVIGEFDTITGKDINEYMRGTTAKVSNSISASLQEVASFSEEVKINFESAKIERGEYAFATSRSRVVKEAYYIADKTGMDAFFTQGFINDLGTMSADKLIEKYGTHVMLGAMLGGRVDYHLSAKKREKGSITGLGAYTQARAKAKYEDFTGEIVRDAGISSTFERNFSTEDIYWKTSVLGGKPEYGQNIHNKQDYDKWIDSIEGNEVWVDYYPGSFIPISDLVTDTDRSNALWEAIISYCDSKGFNIIDEDIKPEIFSKSESGPFKFANKGFEWKLKSSFNKNELRYAGYRYLTITLTYELLPTVAAWGGYVDVSINGNGNLYAPDQVKHEKLKWKGFSLSTKVLLEDYSDNITVNWTASSIGIVNLRNRKITITATK